MPVRTSVLFLVLAVGGVSVASAQDVLTLNAALGEAVAHNAGLGAARAAATSAAAEADAARAGYWPRISVADSWQRGDLPVFVFGSLLSSRRFGAENFAIGALNHPAPVNFFHATFSAEQVIFDGGRTQAGATAARLQRDMADTAVDEAVAGLVVAATRTYGRILAAEASRQAAVAAVSAAAEDIERARARRDAGTATDADVLSLSVHLAAMRQRAIQSDGDAAIARAELNRLMGSPIGREYAVVEPATPDLVDVPLSDLLVEAEQARPELRRAATAAALADNARSRARGSLLPTAAGQAAYELNGTSYGNRAGGWMFGGELRWTWSVGGAELARLRAAGEQVARANAEATDVRAGVQVEVVSALRGLQSARAREDVARVALQQAEEGQRILRDRFEAGLAPVEDVLRASTAFVDADANRVAAVVDAMVAAAALRRAVGRTPDE